MPVLDQPPKPRPSLLGSIALIVIGLLVLIPSGLCTGVIGIGAIYSMVADPKNAANMVVPLYMALIIGGPFAVGGGAMIWIAVRRLHNR